MTVAIGNMSTDETVLTVVHVVIVSTCRSRCTGMYDTGSAVKSYEAVTTFFLFSNKSHRQVARLLSHTTPTTPVPPQL